MEVAEKIDTSDEWKVTMGQSIILEAAHGGEAEDKEPIVTSWLKFLKQHLMTWDQAQLECETLGGWLFYGVNGTSDQLQFLWYKMDLQAMMSTYEFSPGFLL